MSQTRSTAATATSTRTSRRTIRSGLRNLALIRAGFSVIWIALVLATSSSLVPTDHPTLLAAVLLVAYPLWDAAATLLERRLAGTGSLTRVGAATTVLGLLAALAMVVAAFSTIGRMLLVFGVWALLSGAGQLAVALGRWRAVGGQWPSILSGGISVFAGAGFVAMSGSSTSHLSGLAGYSAFGAFWFLVAAVTLHRGSAREKG